jgi:Immunity protein 26
MMAKKLKLPYREGTWFTVPLRNGGYSVGVIARMDAEGGAFGYFFGPKQTEIPSLDNIKHLSATDAVLRARFGALGLLNGEWTVLGATPDWNRDAWPLLPFINVDDESNRAVKVILSDQNLEFISQEPCDARLAKDFPEDACYGYGAVEIVLTKLLDPNWVPAKNQ